MNGNLFLDIACRSAIMDKNPQSMQTCWKWNMGQHHAVCKCLGPYKPAHLPSRSKISSHASKPSKFCLRLHGQTSHNGRQHLSCQEKGAKSHLRLKFRHLIGFVDFDRFRRGLAVERFLQRCNNTILKSISCMSRGFKHPIVATFPKKNQVQYWYGESRIMVDAMLTTWNRLVGEKYPSLLMLIDFLWF